MLCKVTLLLTALAGLASAHQNFHQLWVNGATTGYEKCIRMPPSNNPVTDVTSNDITCNVNGNATPFTSVDVCEANAGDEITVLWDVSSHPGPITHMLYGPVSDAQSATGIGSWFKIEETDQVDGVWANVIMEGNSGIHTFTLPNNLASGDYLLRSEMEALHSSTTLGGTQFYIGCAQLRITGPGGGCSSSITLPGDYQATDDNIYISDFYYGFDAATFTAPGGPVPTCT